MKDMLIAIEYLAISVVFIIFCKMLANFQSYQLAAPFDCKTLNAALILGYIAAIDVYIVSV